jgi:hypothetical protein
MRSAPATGRMSPQGDGSIVGGSRRGRGGRGTEGRSRGMLLEAASTVVDWVSYVETHIVGATPVVG